MTETTRSTESTAPVATLYLALELGSTKWTLAFGTAPAQRPRLRQIAAADLTALTREIMVAKVRFGLVVDAPVRSCYEAGRDGFWVHRWLVATGIDNVVVEARASRSIVEHAARKRIGWTRRSCWRCCSDRPAANECGASSTYRRPRMKPDGS